MFRPHRTCSSGRRHRGNCAFVLPAKYRMLGGDGTFNGTSHKDLQGNAISMDKIVWNPATSAHKTLDTWQPGDGVRPYTLHWKQPVVTFTSAKVASCATRR